MACFIWYTRVLIPDIIGLFDFIKFRLFLRRRYYNIPGVQISFGPLIDYDWSTSFIHKTYTRYLSRGNLRHAYFTNHDIECFQYSQYRYCLLKCRMTSMPPASIWYVPYAIPFSPSDFGCPRLDADSPARKMITCRFAINAKISPSLF